MCLHYRNVSTASTRASSYAEMLIDITGVTIVTSCCDADPLRWICPRLTKRKQDGNPWLNLLVKGKDENSMWLCMLFKSGILKPGMQYQLCLFVFFWQIENVS